MKPVRGILFDKDGTLVDYALTWQPINRRAGALAARDDRTLYEALMRKLGGDPESGRAATGSLLAFGNTAQIARAFIEAGAPWTHFELTRELDRIFLAGAAGAAPVTDLAAFFARLAARGLALGLASNDSEAGAWALADKFGFRAQLAFVAGYDSGLRSKPYPDMAHAFCRRAGLRAADIAVVGDNVTDMEMGRAAGAGLCIAVMTGTGQRAALEAAADVVIDSVASLEATLFAA
jgi:phosphoglycolate phosphatase